MEFDIYLQGRCSKEDDLYFLRFFQEYETASAPIQYQYRLEDSRLADVRRLVENEIRYIPQGTFALQCQLMHWVHRRLVPGDGSPVHPLNTLSVLDQTEKGRCVSNCWVHAIVLNEVFLSFGFLSRMVRCLPLDLRPGDCHCMTLAYSEDHHKWIAFDAAMGTYYTDSDGKPLSLKEMREALIRGEGLGTPFVPRRTSRNLCWYLCKNFIRFQSFQVSCFNMEELECEQVIYTLNPRQYRIKDKEILYASRRVAMKMVYSDDDFWVTK